MSKKIKPASKQVKIEEKPKESITIKLINEIIDILNTKRVPAPLAMHILDMTRQEISDNVTIAKVMEVLKTEKEHVAGEVKNDSKTK